MKNKFLEYSKIKKLRITQSRKLLIDIASKMKVFSTSDLIAKAKNKNISMATTYNFIQTLLDADIIEKRDQYIFKLN